MQIKKGKKTYTKNVGEDLQNKSLLKAIALKGD